MAERQRPPWPCQVPFIFTILSFFILQKLTFRATRRIRADGPRERLSFSFSNFPISHFHFFMFATIRFARIMLWGELDAHPFVTDGEAVRTDRQSVSTGSGDPLERHGNALRGSNPINAFCNSFTGVHQVPSNGFIRGAVTVGDHPGGVVHPPTSS